MKNISLLFILCALILLLNSCGSSDCVCVKNDGCKIVVIKKYTDNSIVYDNIICSKTHYETDTFISNKIYNLNQQYPSSQYYIETRDSIYNTDRVSSVPVDNKTSLEDKGYQCVCGK